MVVLTFPANPPAVRPFASLDFCFRAGISVSSSITGSRPPTALFLLEGVTLLKEYSRFRASFQSHRPSEATTTKMVFLREYCSVFSVCVCSFLFQKYCNCLGCKTPMLASSVEKISTGGYFLSTIMIIIIFFYLKNQFCFLLFF